MRHLRDIEIVELAPDRPTSEAVRAHLETCAACRRKLEEFRRVSETLGRWDVEADADLWPAIERRIGDRRPTVPRPGRLISLRVARIAAALLIGVGLGAGVGRAWFAPADVSPNVQDVDAALALYALEGPDATGLSLALSSVGGDDDAEDAP